MAACDSKPKEKKRKIEACPAPAALNLLLKIQISKDCDYPKAISAIAGTVTLTSSGGIVTTITKSNGDDGDDESAIASIEAHLIKRPTSFHDVCDSISQEIQEFAVSLFDARGAMEDSLREVVSDGTCDKGGLLYITAVSVKEAHRGKDVGILCTQALLQALRGFWTLAAVFPAPLPGTSTTPFNEAVTKLGRYFGRLGFHQVSAAAPLARYWVLEASAFRSACDAIVPKARAAEQIQVAIPPEDPKLEGVDEEMNKFLLGSDTADASSLRQMALAMQARGYDPNRARSLHYMVADRKLRAVLLLVEQFGAAVNQQDAFGQTALHIAAHDLNAKAVALLLSVGADKTRADAQGRLPAALVKESMKNNRAFLKSMCMPADTFDTTDAALCMQLLK